MSASALNNPYSERRLNLMALSLVLALGPVLAFCALALQFETILVLLLVLGASAVVFFRSDLSLYLLVFLLPVAENFVNLEMHYPTSISTDMMPLFPVVAALATVGILMRKAARVTDADFSTPVNFFVVSFLFWATVSVLWAPDFRHTILELSILVAGVMIFYLVVSAVRKDPHLLHRLIVAVIVSGVIHAALAIWSLHYLEQNIEGIAFPDQLVSLNYSIKHADFRAKALANSNFTAYFLNVALAFAVCFRLRIKGRITGFLFSSIIAFLIFGVLETKSKGGIGSMIFLGLFCITALHRLRKKFFKNFLMATTLVISLFIAQNINSGREPRILGTEELSLGARLEIWGNGLKDLMTYAPGWGLGVGGLRAYEDPLPHAHSIYFSVLFDFGIVGVLLLAGLALALGAKMLKLLPRQETKAGTMLVGAAGSLLAAGVHGLVDFHYQNPVIWFCLAIAVTTVHLAEEKGGVSPR